MLDSTAHGALDYLAAAGLIVFPMLLGFEGLPFWLSVAGGVGLIGYSLLTDYKFGAVPALSFNDHLALDLVAALVFIAAPVLLGWDALLTGYYLLMATGVIAVVLLSRRELSAA